MKILLVTGKFPQLSETFIIRKASALASKGHDVLIMTRRRGDLSVLTSFPGQKFSIEYLPADGGPFTALEILRNIKCILTYGLLYPLRTLRLLKILADGPAKGSYVKQVLRYIAFINKQDYDIIHFEFLSLVPMYGRIKEVVTAKQVISCRGSDTHLLPLRSQADQEIYRKIFSDVSAIHCVSGEMQQFVRKFSPSTSKIFVNRPAVESGLINVKRAVEVNEVPLIISTGRLEWIKGYDYLLKAYAILRQKGIRFRAMIIGGGNLYNELKFSIEDLKLEDCVQLTGAISPSEVLTRLQGADIFVLSSHEEGISNAVLEAMAMELAVVSTRCGGMPEVIEDGVNGLLVPVRDPSALAIGLSKLIASPELRNKFGANARETISKSFLLSRQVAVFEEEYGSLLQKDIHGDNNKG